jgi:ubiquinone/menaquinone biosynthesis C-methylase UbiE
MDTRNAYNKWSFQYDTNENKTRDLEGIALRKSLEKISFSRCLEIGCGTGKNTAWLVERAAQITAVDLSEEMLARAKQKIAASNVEFKQADINATWDFAGSYFDLITFSLVLEHIENLDHIFEQVSESLKKGGHVYIGELHPFKQYTGTKARFEAGEGLQVLECYTHHISDFTETAKKYGLELVEVNEYFDDNNKTSIPRILMIILKKAV